ncbi:hypothetical protein E2H86_13105 [Pseudomonas putida]|uniref:T6SS effector BTH_I2691 family protein n=1 Tax=Pseudomonas putida TaxID=303 RepID=UPI001059512C|nr:T6SS effector BTH_I2691 family protein [Pseudomonas putida]TDJ76069.1 hypothetical protein E2H86_13105 [Pseudomonas putida]
MSISKAIHIAMQEEIPNPHGTCKACERSGLPILLLREAYAPHPRDTKSYLVAHDSGITHVPLLSNQLRTLRQGYVYVLLDQEIWQAYQVSPEGTLLQFPVSQMPFAPGESLPDVCYTHNHDVIASFININTALYRKAWIAIANDPWPRDVLDRYRDGIANQRPDFIDRFVELDLEIARNDPGSVGIAMTESDLGLGDVLEYGAAYPGKFTSAHGFYSRMSRLPATRNFVRTKVLEEELPNGVLALTVPDPVGLVMEANVQRTTWVRRMQEWRAEPQRHFEYFTSQALLGIRELNEARAAAQAVVDTAQEAENREKWNESPIGFKAYLPPVDIEAHTQRATKNKQEEARERLEERYDEKARAAFQAGYDREVKHWQTRIDKAGELYATLYGHRSFQRIAYFDYSATSPLSVEYFIQMLSACVAGGPTEKAPEQDDPLGPTQYLWQQLLEDPNSLLYQALTAKNQSLRQQLVKALSSNDLTQVYHAVKGIALSEEGQYLMVKPVQDAIGLLLAAAASASSALGKHITERTRSLVGHVHSSAFLLFAGQPITQVRLTLTLGEYMSLLNEALHERTDAFLGQLDKHFRRPAGRKVRAMVLSGAIHLAGAGKNKQMIEVFIWTLESAENLQAKLLNLRDSTTGSISNILRHATIGADTLRQTFSSTAEQFKISAAAAQDIASDAARALRNAGNDLNSGGLLLALGSIWFHQDSLRKNILALERALPGNPETVAAVWSSSIAYLGTMVEAAGFALNLLVPDKKAPALSTKLSTGTLVIKIGGAIIAIAGLMDSAQFFEAGLRSRRSQDLKSAFQYRLASTFALASSAFGAAGSLGSAALFGPLGIAIVLGLMAYTLASLAKHNESSAIEAWARKSRWGRPGNSRSWTQSTHLDDAIGALNAAALGVQVDASIQIRFAAYQNTSRPSTLGGIVEDGNSVPTALALSYFICLPRFHYKHSQYDWTLDLFRCGQTAPAARLSGDHNSPPEAPIADPKARNIFSSTENLTRTRIDLNNETLIIQGEHLLSDVSNISSIELRATYWPDKNDVNGYSRITLKEDKIRLM